MYGQTEGWTDRPYFIGPSWLRPGVQKMVLKIPILILFHFYLLCWFSPAFCLYCSCKLFWLYRPLQVALACFRWLKHILGCFSSFLTLVSTTKTAPQKLWNFSRRDIISFYCWHWRVLPKALQMYMVQKTFRYSIMIAAVSFMPWDCKS